MTISSAIRAAQTVLTKKKIPMAYLDAELLLAFVLKKDRTYVLAHNEQTLSKIQYARFKMLVQKRAKRMPLAYIVGRKEFYGLSFYVSPGVLIPRPDTETLISTILDYIGKHNDVHSILDVGTGSGCISLSLAAHINKAIKIEASDISSKALTLAKKNAKALHLEKRIRYSKQNLLKGTNKKYDIIVANLPYVSKKEYLLAIKQFPEIKYEPISALLSGKDGLDAIRLLLSQAPKNIKKQGAIFLEIGYEQGHAVTNIALQYLPKAVIQVIKDDCKNDRIVFIQT